MRRSTGSGSSAVHPADAPASLRGQDRLSEVVFGSDLLLNASQHQAIAASYRKRPQMRAVFFDFWRDRLSLQFAQRFTLLIPACLFERVAAPSWKRAYVLAVFPNIEFRRKLAAVRLRRFALGRWRCGGGWSSHDGLPFRWAIRAVSLEILLVGFLVSVKRAARRFRLFGEGRSRIIGVFWVGKLGDVFDQLLAARSGGGYRGDQDKDSEFHCNAPSRQSPHQSITRTTARSSRG